MLCLRARKDLEGFPGEVDLSVQRHKTFILSTCVQSQRLLKVRVSSP